MMEVVQTNQAMARLLKNADARKAVLPAKLADLLSQGFVKKEGCYFLAVLYAGSLNARRDMFPDATGYEAYVNHLHIDDFTDDGDQLSICLLYLDHLTHLWKTSEFSEVPIQADVSYDGESCVVRFHALRIGEQWQSDNLEAYDESVFVAGL
jgi:hypothetical protein